MARSATALDFGVLAAPHYEVRCRLRIENTLIENVLGSNPFLSGSITATLDAPVIQAQFRCHSGSGFQNLSPLISGGASLSGRPMFDVGRSIAFDTSCDLPGTGPANWHRVFEGGIDAVSIEDGDTLVVECRDSISVALQKWIDIISVTDQGPQFGFPVTGQRVDLAIQSVLDQAYSGGFGEPFVVQGIPGLAITDYWQDPMLLMDAVRRLGLQNGWDLRGKWDQNGPDTFDLTYYNPDRDVSGTTIVYISPGTAFFDGPKYTAITGMRIDLSTMRNRIQVVPADATRVPQVADDPASQLKYGVKAAQVSEDRASHIDTEAEALTLAQLILADSRDARIDLEIAMNYYWIPEVNDAFGVVGNDIHFDSGLANVLVVAIEGYTHTFAEDGDATTVLRTRTRPAAAGSKEWRRGVPRMQYSSLTEPAGPGVEGATWLQILDDALPTVL